MDSQEFRKYGHQLVDWIGDYYDQIEKYPVKSQVKPGEIFETFEDTPPQEAQDFQKTFEQFEDRIMPGITHWQHPNFHAYFPANTSFPSILGEMFTSGIAAQCMIWETSPAAAELEEKLMEWLKQMMNLPKDWSGVIQDTASTSTLAALLVAREQKSDHQINKQGFNTNKYRVYCSTQTHSSIDKAVKIAGFGIENLVKINVNDQLAMDPKALEAAILEDLDKGMIPCAVVTTLGTTSTLAMDPLKEINDVCLKYNLWNHIDAAYAGNAFILEKYQHFISDLGRADSYVFNPHKWLFVNFDCSVFFIKDKEALLRTFEILPEYLKTGTRGSVNDYRDWGIPLGRRFRALKLWMVIRTFGVRGLQKKISNQIQMTEWLEHQIAQQRDFEMMTPRFLNMLVFRYAPSTDQSLDQLNKHLIQKINQSGWAFLTHTKIDDQFVIRLVIGQTNVDIKHVKKIWELILSASQSL
jgi:aromatic-L-amino-acid decarboxylase